MVKASDSVGQSNRAHLKLQHDLFFFPSLPALFGFFPPLTPVTSEYPFPWLYQRGVRSHPGLGRASLGPCAGETLFLALSSKGGSEGYLGYPGRPGITGQSSAKGSACPLESCRCGSWVPLPATSILHQEGARKASLDVHSRLWCRARTRTVLPVKQLAGMLCHKYQEVSSSGHYRDVALSRLANAATPLWRLPYQEQLQDSSAGEV
ncbi:uncharacterized protein WM294_007764 isoform 3-T3 [Sarcoramphus papa]